MVSINKSIGKSVFLKIFGDSPVNKVLDFLIVFNKFDYSMREIADKSGVGYSTLKILLPDLLKSQIIIQTRISGKSKMYKINENNLIVKKIIDFYWDITNEIVRKELKLPGKKVEKPVVARN